MQVVGSDTVTLDHVAQRDQILVPASFTSSCHRITMWETNGTSPYTLSNSQNRANPGIQFPPGYVKVFSRSKDQPPFQAGELICYGEVPTGTIVFNLLGEEELIS